MPPSTHPTHAARRSLTSRRLLTVALAAVVAAGGAVASSADHTAPPARVTLMGSLMDELGCEAEWDEECTATDMHEGDDGQWTLTADVPAGSYEWKVRLNGSWDENYGTPNGGNVPLVLLGDATVTFSYDHQDHTVAMAPGDPVEDGVTDDDRQRARDSLRTDLTRERFYFVMADRFANGDPGNDTGGIPVPGGTPPGEARLHHGLDASDTAFFHGGDLQGIIDRLDYIQGLGTTAIWLTPSFTNKPVQGAPGSESAGYHGYWITDFTSIDPHLGTNEDMAALVDAAHARGMKVFFDIITNHTADVIAYDADEHDAGGTLPYVSTADQPYVDVTGAPFDDRDHADGTVPFPEVNLDSFPYRPIVPADEQDVKIPAVLNDPTLYHSRGTSTFAGESNTYGDFPSGPYSSLDDLWTEHPVVVDTMIDVYEAWVTEVGIDGFRIDTVKHVNIEFWQQFAPALEGHAASMGNDDFFMFGEVYDANPAFVSTYTTEGQLQAAADFGFQSSAVQWVRGGSSQDLQAFFASDDWFTDHDSNVYSLPTFLGNHDMGRVGSFLLADGSSPDDPAVLRRDQLAHALLFLSRGQPVVYYGDEQGFAAPPDVPGGIGDQRAREDMFPTQVDLYAGYDTIGSDATPADANFDTAHPLYRTIATLGALRDRHPALANGTQVHRAATDDGVYAFSRIDADRQREYLVVLNNSTESREATIDTFSPFVRYRKVWSLDQPGARRLFGLAGHTDGAGELTVEVPALGADVYMAVRPVRDDRSAPEPAFAAPTPGATVGGRTEVVVDVPGDSYVQVSFAMRPVGTDEWQPIGTDDQAPFRVMPDVAPFAEGTLLEVRAVAHDAEGDMGVVQTHAVVGTPPPPPPDDDGEVQQPDMVTLPGTFQDAVGCPNEWDPACEDVALSLDDEDLVWTATFAEANAVPAGTYAYKVAIDGSWDENYGVGGERDGANISLDADGEPITFIYSHATNWVTTSLESPHVFTAAGSFQDELGCPGDWLADCLRSWLQDPDDDGVWTFRTRLLPAGDYAVKVTQDQSWDVNWGAGGVPDGPDIPFSVGEGDGVAITFDEASKAIAVTTYEPGD